MKKKVYDEHSYWSKRQNPNNATDIETQKHLDFLYQSIRKHRNVLDFGPGVGRLLEAFAHVESLELYDISNVYKDRITEKLADKSFKYNITIEKSIKKLPYQDKQFDIVTAASVLLHQRPTNIEKVMKELARVSCGEVVVITYMDPAKKYIEPTSQSQKSYITSCFNYDYRKICENLNFKISFWQYDSEDFQLYFKYQRN